MRRGSLFLPDVTLPLRDLARTSIEVSFAGPDIKEKMRGNLSEWGMGLETFDEKRS